MNAVVNTVARLKPELLTDSSGMPVTTKVNGDWTKTARLLDGIGATTATLTITHKASGYYDPSFTPTAVGNWSVEYSVVVDGETVYFDPQFVEVISTVHAALLESGLNAADVARIRLIGSGTVSLSPTAADPSIVPITRGDDETVSISEPDSGWPSLVSAQSVTLTLINRVGGIVLTVTGTVTSSTPGSQAVSFELTDTQTGSLRIGAAAYRFSAKAVLSNGDDETLAFGTVTVAR